MIINNLPDDLKRLSRLENKPFAQVGEELGLPRGNISRSVNNGSINGRWIDIVESLGYDIKITYVKRADKAKDVLNK